MTTSETSISITDIRAAYDPIKDHVVRTPLLESGRLNDVLSCRVLIKAECLQRTGSFKFRGAFNRALLLSAEQRRAGIVAWSSGNHALAIAAVCNRLSIPAVIVMPDDAPKSKIAGARHYGTEIIFYDRRADDREAIGQDIAATRGAVIVPRTVTSRSSPGRARSASKSSNSSMTYTFVRTRSLLPAAEAVLSPALQLQSSVRYPKRQCTRLSLDNSTNWRDRSNRASRNQTPRVQYRYATLFRCCDRVT
jgi:hypothetical protein